MAKSTKASRARRADAPREARQLGDTGAQIVKAAARLLDQEVALGITAAKAVQQRLQRERRVESTDFKAALARFQADARDIINALDHQLDGTQLRENTELAKQFVAKTNDLLDIVVAVITTGAELTNELLQANLSKQESEPVRKSRR